MADVIACMALSAIARRIRPQLIALGVCSQLDMDAGRRAFGDAIPEPSLPFRAVHIGILDDECSPLATADTLLSGIELSLIPI